MIRTLGVAAALLGLAATGPALALGICVEGAYPPFSEVAADGSVVGFDVDIAGEVARDELRLRIAAGRRQVRRGVDDREIVRAQRAREPFGRYEAIHRRRA